MSELKKVSIIIASYNRKDRLQKAIDSVLNQTYPNIELIVVDDHSTDGTNEVLEGYGDRISHITLAENSGGPAKPRNIGIMASTGDYVGFLDSDNEFRPDHVTILVNELDRDQSLDLVYGDRYMIFEDDPSKNNIGIYHDFDSATLMQKNFIDTSDFLIRREPLFTIGGWDEGHKRMLDWNLAARLDKAGYTLRREPKIITDYYVHGEGMLSDSSMDNEWCVLTMPGGVKVAGAHDCDIVLPYLGEKPEPTVALFTITYGRLKYTQESFASLHATADYPFDHYIVDNKSEEDVSEYLKEYQAKYPDRVHLLFNEDNKGISVASNQILKVIKESGKNYSIIGKFDNDAYCRTKGWLKAMVNIWKANHKLALSCYISGLKDNAGGVPRYEYGRIKNELLGMTKHLGGICCFTSADIRLGFKLDEAETLHTADDLFFSKYIQQKGYQMAYLENYYINHGPIGTEAQAKDYPEYFSQRRYEKTHRYEKGQDA